MITHKKTTAAASNQTNEKKKKRFQLVGFLLLFTSFRHSQIDVVTREEFTESKRRNVRVYVDVLFVFVAALISVFVFGATPLPYRVCLALPSNSSVSFLFMNEREREGLLVFLHHFRQLLLLYPRISIHTALAFRPLVNKTRQDKTKRIATKEATIELFENSGLWYHMKLPRGSIIPTHPHPHTHTKCLDHILAWLTEETKPNETKRNEWTVARHRSVRVNE